MPQRAGSFAHQGTSYVRGGGRAAALLLALCLGLGCGLFDSEGGKPPDAGTPDSGTPDVTTPVQLSTHLLPLAAGDRVHRLVAVEGGFGLVFFRPGASGSGDMTALYQAFSTSFAPLGAPYELGLFGNTLSLHTGTVEVLTHAPSEVLLLVRPRQAGDAHRLHRVTHSSTGLQAQPVVALTALAEGAQLLGAATSGAHGLALAWQEATQVYGAVLDEAGQATTARTALDLTVASDGEDSSRLRFLPGSLVADGAGYALAVGAERSPVSPGPPSYELRVRRFGADLGAQGETVVHALGGGGTTFQVQPELLRRDDGTLQLLWSFARRMTGSTTFSVSAALPASAAPLQLASGANTDLYPVHYFSAVATPAGVTLLQRSEGRLQLVALAPGASAAPTPWELGLEATWLARGAQWVPGRVLSFVAAYHDREGRPAIVESVLAPQ